jgi:hypothetical protein
LPRREARAVPGPSEPLAGALLFDSMWSVFDACGHLRRVVAEQALGVETSTWRDGGDTRR